MLVQTRPNGALFIRQEPSHLLQCNCCVVAGDLRLDALHKPLLTGEDHFLHVYEGMFGLCSLSLYTLVMSDNFLGGYCGY